jgi:hypothetical protein
MHFLGVQCCFVGFDLKVIVVLKLSSDWVIATFTLSVCLWDRSRLPSALSEILTTLLCPAANVMLVVPSRTIFFRGLALAVTAITLPCLIVSVTVNVNLTEQVVPALPVQLTRRLAVGPLVVARVMVGVPGAADVPGAPEGLAAADVPGAPEGLAGEACTTAVCDDSTVAPPPFALDAASKTRIVEPTSAAARV